MDIINSLYALSVITVSTLKSIDLLGGFRPSRRNHDNQAAMETHTTKLVRSTSDSTRRLMGLFFSMLLIVTSLGILLLVESGPAGSAALTNGGAARIVRACFGLLLGLYCLRL